MDDSEYRDGLDKLESGELEAAQIADLVREGSARINTAIGPGHSRLAEILASALRYYYHTEIDTRRLKKSQEKIAKAALRLADTLRDSGGSNFYRTNDHSIWSIALALIEKPNLTSDPRKMPSGPSMSLETYLRALAEACSDDGLPSWIEIKNPTGRKVALRTYVVQYIRQLLETQLAIEQNGARRDRKDAKPNPWAGLATVGESPNEKPEIHRNVMTAEFAKILLADANITRNDVAKLCVPGENFSQDI